MLQASLAGASDAALLSQRQGNASLKAPWLWLPYGSGSARPGWRGLADSRPWVAREADGLEAPPPRVDTQYAREAQPGDSSGAASQKKEKEQGKGSTEGGKRQPQPFGVSRSREGMSQPVRGLGLPQAIAQAVGPIMARRLHASLALYLVPRLTRTLPVAISAGVAAAGRSQAMLEGMRQTGRIEGRSLSWLEEPGFTDVMASADASERETAMSLQAGQMDSLVRDAARVERALQRGVDYASGWGARAGLHYGIYQAAYAEEALRLALASQMSSLHSDEVPRYDRRSAGGIPPDAGDKDAK